MSTILGSSQVRLSDISIHRSIDSPAEVGELHPKLPYKEIYANVIGIMGLAVTLTVLVSGVYVFIHYLL